MGNIEEGLYSANGTLYYPNGNIQYEGEFLDGKYHGKGTLYSSYGKVIEKGNYVNGELKDGKIYSE